MFTSNTISRGAQNTAQQLFLLKALQITKDPNELRKMIGVKTVAEVYRTLDKLAMRKEYHAALIRSGISLDFIVGGIKEIAVGGFKDSDKLNALKTLLTSLGMDKYEDDGGQTRGSWEEILLEKLEEEKKSKLLGDGKEKTDEEIEKMREEELKADPFYQTLETQLEQARKHQEHVIKEHVVKNNTGTPQQPLSVAQQQVEGVKAKNTMTEIL